MNELMNFDALGEVVVNLTNKLANGVGWIANRDTPKKIAINTYIKEIQEKDYDPIVKGALISNARKTIKEYCNQNDIFKIATQFLDQEAHPENINNYWIGQFMDKAKLVSDKDFQWIWGKVLARECNEPGSIPHVLLHTLEKMDQEDAEAFTRLCRTAVHVDEGCAPVIIGSKFDEYKNLIGINYDSLVNLSALGLIKMDLGGLALGYALVSEKVPAKVTYFEMEYERLKDNEFDVGNVLFTKSGQALCQSLNVEKIEGFWEKYCLPLWEKECS